MDGPCLFTKNAVCASLPAALIPNKPGAAGGGGPSGGGADPPPAASVLATSLSLLTRAIVDAIAGGAGW